MACGISSRLVAAFTSPPASPMKRTGCSASSPKINCAQEESNVRSWDLLELAIVEDKKRFGFRTGDERLLGTIDALIRELKRSMMNRDARLGAENLVRSSRLLRGHVDGRHEPARFVSSDGQECEARRAESFPDLGEMIPKRSISREIHDSVMGFDHVPAP